MASIGNYIYAVSQRAIYVNLYVAGSATVNGVKLTQETRYPRDGEIAIQVDQASRAAFTVAVRIPGGCRIWQGRACMSSSMSPPRVPQSM